MKFLARLRDRFKAAAKPTTHRIGDAGILEWLGLKRGAENARENVTYFTCLKQLSETLAKMPIKIYREAEKGAEEIERGEKDLNHLAYLLQLRPNPYMTPTTFWAAVENNRNHYGNAYVYIRRRLVRQRFGGYWQVEDLWIMPSNCVRVLVDNAGVFGRDGGLWYVYTDHITKKRYVFPPDDVLHFKTSHTFNGLVGESIQSILASTVQGIQASQEYLDKLYEQGMTAKSVLEYTGDLSEQAKQALREAIEEFGNGTQNAGRVLPIPLGFKLTPLDIKLTDAQFFELKKYGALQLAAAFGIKPNQINDYEKASYANSEQQTIAFQVDTMQYILKQYEEEMEYKLLMYMPETDHIYIKHNEKAILRTDSETQMKILAQAVDHAIYTPNEARRYLDKKATPGGDQLIVNAGTVSLKDMGMQFKKGKEEQNGESH